MKTKSKYKHFDYEIARKTMDNKIQKPNKPFVSEDNKDNMDFWYKRYMEAVKRGICRIDRRKQINSYTIYITSSGNHIRYHL